MAINEPSDNLPLADVLRAANGLVAAGLIEDWALGGALAAIYYVEPFATCDADIFFIPKDQGLTAGIPAIYAHLQSQGWQIEREHLLARGFPVQFLAAVGLTEEAAPRPSESITKACPPGFFVLNTSWPLRQRGAGQGQGPHRTTAAAGRPRQNLFGKRSPGIS